jgi:hypothetical protein
MPAIPGCVRRYSLLFRASICGANRLLVKQLGRLLPEICSAAKADISKVQADLQTKDASSVIDAQTEARLIP